MKIDRRDERELTALIPSMRLLGRKDVPRPRGDNRIEVVLSILIISDRANGGSSGARLDG